jgi:two-component system chemotaxis response regulator CheY
VRVLVVDDSMTMRRIVIDAVRAFSDADILEAESAEDALDILVRTPGIGLMLLDFHLPGMSGLDLLQKMRQDPKTASVPVVMVTSEREKAYVISALRAGAKNYIVKPFTQQVFKKKVGPHLDAPVDAAAQPTGRLVGSLGQTSPLEVIQLISMTKKSGVLEFEGQGQKYEIHFKAGQIQHASGGGATGEKAVAGAAALVDGVFTFRAEEVEHPITVRRSTEMIMLEAMGRPAP